MAANTDNGKAGTIGINGREEKRTEEKVTKRKQVFKSDHMHFIWSQNEKRVRTKKRKNYKD